MVRPLLLDFSLKHLLLPCRNLFDSLACRSHSNILPVGIYYSFFEAFPLVYIGIYGFNIGELSVVYTAIVVGVVVGIIAYCSYVYFYLEPDIKKNGLRAQEHRLVPALFAVTLMPAGMFWFGWTSKSDIHWMVSIIGNTFYATGAFVLYVLQPPKSPPGPVPR